MICPHCLKTISDDASFCPHCHAYVGGDVRAEFIFCEGCGARLAPTDRSCPKCGRPAPGILSADSSASDLAAGRTASFPRLTKQLIDAEVPDLRQDVAASSAPVPVPDPFSTNVLAAEDLGLAGASQDGGDPYHGPQKRRKAPVIAAIVLAVLIAGGAYLAIADPLGVMPGLQQQLKQAASEMFPSRMPEPGSAVDAADAAESEAEKAKRDADRSPLTDEQAFQRLSAAYERITAQHDALDDIIDDYNAGYIAADHAKREDRARSAYAARDVLDSVVEELQSMNLPQDSARRGDAGNLVALAQLVRQRVDRYCASWDVSLSFTGDDKPSAHEDEILAPLRDRAGEDAQARDNYFAHVGEWKPTE